MDSKLEAWVSLAKMFKAGGSCKHRSPLHLLQNSYICTMESVPMGGEPGPGPWDLDLYLFPPPSIQQWKKSICQWDWTGQMLLRCKDIPMSAALVRMLSRLHGRGKSNHPIEARD